MIQKMAPATSEDCTGLMAFWADIDEDYVLRYQQWHNCEHVPERVSIPGFVEGRRYRDLGASSRFLMYYDTADAKVLSSEAYMAALNKPTNWTREALTHFKNPTRDIFHRIAMASKHFPFAAPYITSMRFDLPDGGEEIFTGAWLQVLTALKYVIRVRLYKADTDIGKMGTSESKVHGGGPGKQTYLVLIEQSLPHIETGSAIAHADSQTKERVQRGSEQIGEYWLEMAHTKREAP
jgi:hypothetical protein